MRQFAYVLSPARTWAGFGGLDVTVRVPLDWRAAVTPPLSREGDVLRARFAAVPADALALTVQAPAGAYAIAVGYATRVLLALVMIGGGFGVVWWTRTSERRRPRLTGAGLTALGRGLVWGLAMFAAGWLTIEGPDLALPAGQADHYGYGRELGLIGVALGAVVTTVLGAVLSSAVRRRVHQSAMGTGTDDASPARPS